MKLLPAILLSLGLVGAAVAAETRALHRLRLDGALALELMVEMGTLPSGDSLRVGVRHELERDARGREKSSWRYVGLSGYLVQESESSWVAELPGPAFIRLSKRKDPGRDGIIAQRGRVLLKQGPGGLALINGSKGTYYFSDGLLQAWRDGTGYYLTRMQGGRIASIVREGSRHTPVLEAIYRPTGEPESVRFDDCVVVFEYASSGQLSKISVSKAGVPADGHDLSYGDGLLQSVAGATEVIGPLKWRAPDKTDPVQTRRTILAGDGQFDYAYTTKSGIIAMRATNLKTGKTEVITYNAFASRNAKGGP